MNGYQGLVLAAGAGERFGGRKLTADWQGRPLVMAAVEAALGAPVDTVIVVLGCDASTVAAALAPLAGPRLQLVVAEGWRDGMAATLRQGVQSLPATSRGFLLFLGDMPLIPRALPPSVLAHLEAGAPAAQPFHGGVPAHPVGFSLALYEDLLALTGDRGAAALLRDRPGVIRIEAGDAGAVFDVDHPADLTKVTE